MLAAAGSWPLEMAARVVHLFGAFSDLERIGGNETGFRLFISNLHCRLDDPAAAQSRALLSAPERRPAVLRGVDLGRWVPAPEVCRQWLQELLTAEVASLKLLEEALRRGKDGAAHDRVMRMAKMLPEGDLSRQYLRYRKEADSRFLRGHRALLAALEQDAERAEDVADEDCDEDAGAGLPVEPPVDGDLVAPPTVTTAPPAAGAVLTAGKVDSPNEPGNEKIATTVPPAGGNGLLALLLLALLLGQLSEIVGWASPTNSRQEVWAVPTLRGRDTPCWITTTLTKNLNSLPCFHNGFSHPAVLLCEHPGRHCGPARWDQSIPCSSVAFVSSHPSEVIPWHHQDRGPSH
jgi:hypothetical protein